MLRICSLIVLIASPAFAQSVVGVARVIDGDTLEVAGERVRLFGIDAPEAGQACRDAAGRRWDCGAHATARLEALSGGAVRCEGRERDRYGRLVARCAAGGQDLGAAMVAEGAAFAYARYSADYLPAEAAARAARRGVWAGAAERPEDRRRAAAPAPGGCVIKGNISDKGRLYHLPGSAAYDRTRIAPGKGERWFCTETEAQAAGWRRAGG
ncbi:succinoglycan biosynthesis protein [Rhodobacter veldkampii DSM 11550]|uniref:Succinoglycan biosynthesis protein n=1 Tax=Phaeovulum veldkampii DSM 11550 TaxID=1185920 RepID=A0A2T4JGP2_9RHOB|nr:thermonuclease family protein [Phaeovulum veldkampii]MBK5947541.1 succinoglycan biosynthesis protein [Phaeovulum veldkampii DSM 11550]NCU20664.1 thermonuclease family protein [Candidatus Falkowbacteria bacterium]PTE16988.1 succinoglycan biosynthesis protein [Phaeovulum veldkampii DSM 11550]